jgi:sodium transport system ATP-binding protein
MIEVRGLTKHFYSPRQVTAVDGVSFRCEAGAVFGLLGPNGAGKSTTLRMLSTLLAPDEGSAVLHGSSVKEDPEGVRGSIGYLSTTTGLYGRLTAREMIHYFARLQGVADPRGRTDQLMERFDIHPFAHVRCDRLSTGMRQKVSIARAVVHDPPILILDEPTAGLDVLVARTFLEFVEQARDEGRCVLFSTHIMSEAERLCDRVAILHQGRILADDVPSALKDASGCRYLEDVFVHYVQQAEREAAGGA